MPFKGQHSNTLCTWIHDHGQNKQATSKSMDKISKTMNTTINNDIIYRILRKYTDLKMQLCCIVKVKGQDQTLSQVNGQLFLPTLTAVADPSTESISVSPPLILVLKK